MSAALWQKLADSGIVQGEPPQASARASWPVRVMLGIAGWIGALCLLVFAGLAFEAIFRNAAAALVPVARRYCAPSLDGSPSAESTATPGASSVGFSSSSTSPSPSETRGPLGLNDGHESSPGRPERCTSHALTAITPSPAAGEGTRVPPSLPIEATTTMPSSWPRRSRTRASPAT